MCLAQLFATAFLHISETLHSHSIRSDDIPKHTILHVINIPATFQRSKDCRTVRAIQIFIVIMSFSLTSHHSMLDTVGWTTGKASGLCKTRCWFVGGDDLTGALHVL